LSTASGPFDTIRMSKVDSLILDLMTAPENNLAKVTPMMAEKGIHEVFLPEDKNRCGMITLTDILRESNMETKLGTLMVHVPVLSMESTIGEVARIMTDYRIRSAPVSDGHKIVGQVNASSFLRLLKGNLKGVRITSLAKGNPVTMNEDDSAATARELMARKRINHIPIKHRDRLVGLVTSTQILALLPARERIGVKSRSPETRPGLDFPVKDIMDSDPLKCLPHTTAEDALNRMLNHDRTCVLVAQWDELQGIATQRDFITLLAESEEKPEVPVYMVGLPDDPFEAEVAKEKFKRTINQLHKVLPQILEARSVIKSTSSTPGKERKRYEVTVHIKTPTSSYSYAASGWQLVEVYDTVTDRLKRILSQKEQRRKQFVRERA
jgi:CBS domain-containing protein